MGEIQEGFWLYNCFGGIVVWGCFLICLFFVSVFYTPPPSKSVSLPPLPAPAAFCSTVFSVPANTSVSVIGSPCPNAVGEVPNKTGKETNDWHRAALPLQFCCHGNPFCAFCRIDLIDPPPPQKRVKLTDTWWSRLYKLIQMPLDEAHYRLCVFKVEKKRSECASAGPWFINRSGSLSPARPAGCRNNWAHNEVQRQLITTIAAFLVVHHTFTFLHYSR